MTMPLILLGSMESFPLMETEVASTDEAELKQGMNSPNMKEIIMLIGVILKNLFGRIYLNHDLDYSVNTAKGVTLL